MARATNKNELINNSEENYSKLLLLVQSLTKEELEQLFSFEDRDKQVRDVLIHLYEWHQLLIKWIKLNTSETKANFLPEPYNWRTYPEMNIKFWEKHQNTSLGDAMRLLDESHLDAMDLISTFSNEELFTKKYFDWTGGTNLGSYCISSTASHYDWAIKKIKKHKKTINQ